MSRRQLVEAGVPGHAIDARVRSGALVVLYRGVYRAGPVAGPRAREWAAVLACGLGSALSHGTAARVWGLLDAPGTGDVQVTTATVQRRPGGGIRTHRATLGAGERTLRDGLPVTTVPRTLLDLSRTASPRKLEQAVAVALRRRLTTRRALAAAVAGWARWPGSAALRELLEAKRDPAFARSEAEERLLALVRRGGLPEPRTNVRLDGFEVDFLWPDAGLVVEVDGFEYHASRSAFDRDRRRDRAIRAAGHQLLRFTWSDLTEGPEEVLARVAQALARSVA